VGGIALLGWRGIEVDRGLAADYVAITLNQNVVMRLVVLARLVVASGSVADDPLHFRSRKPPGRQCL